MKELRDLTDLTIHDGQPISGERCCAICLFPVRAVQGYLAHKKQASTGAEFNYFIRSRRIVETKGRVVQGYLAHKKQPPPRTLQ